MLLHQDQRQVIAQRIDPKIILANNILQLSTMELAQSIENELMDNPALEVLEETACAGDCVDPASCPYCSSRTTRENDSDYHGESPDSGDHETEYEANYDFLPSDGEEEYDPVGNLEAEMTLQEHLQNLLRAAVPAEDYHIGEYLINSLNERGWLGTSTETLALELGVPESEICRLLGVIQSFDPPGVGARDLRECLLLQLDYLRDEDLSPEDARINALTEKLVRECFHHVSPSRYQKLARIGGVSIAEAKQCLEYIQKRLNPFPASQFRPPWAYRPSNNKATVRPDVIIRRTEFGYDVEVVGAEPFALCITPHYRDAYQHIKSGSGYFSEDDRKHILEYVERAELFIRNIKQRRQTLRLITRNIIDHQTGFLATGSRQFLRLLTRTRVAQLLNLHESTVSRATANKFVQLPNQEVVGFDLFFDSSLSIKDAITAIIQDEDPANPLSDKQIAEMLTEKGISVARRTIVKYREQQKILSSTRRRR